MSFSFISFAAYIYIIAATFVCIFIPLPESVKSIIAQPALLLIPYLVGKPVLYLSRKILSIKESNDFAIEALACWFLGTIVMVTIEAVLYVNYLFFLDSFTIIILIIGLPSIFMRDNNSSNSLRHWSVAAVAIYALMFSLFVTRYWPYPYTNDNDIITHTFMMTRIVTQNRPLLFYNDYLPTMHTIYAVMMRLFNVSPYKEPLYLLWASRFILYPVYGVGLYLFAYQFSKKRMLAVLAATIGVSLVSMMNACIFPYGTAPKNFIDLLIIYGLYAGTYFYQNNERRIKIFPSLVGLGVMVVLVFVVLYFIRVAIGPIGYEIGWVLPLLLMAIILLPWLTGQKYRNFFLTLSIILSGLVYMSKLQGFQAAGVILAFIFFMWLAGKMGDRVVQLAVIFFTGLTLTVFILFQFKIIAFPAEALLFADPQNSGYWPWGDIVKYISYIYPTIILFLLAAGCIFAIISRGEGKNYRSPVIMAAIILLAYFLPINYSFRFLGDANPFIMLLAAFAIIQLLRIDEISLHKNMSILPLALMTAFIGVTIYTNDMNIFPNGEPYVWNKDTLQIITVGTYIKDHVDKNALIIQLKFYQGLQAFYGGVDTAFLWKSGLIFNSDVSDIYSAETAEDAYNKIKAVIAQQDQVVRYADKDSKDIKRFYRPPSAVYLLADEDYMWNTIGVENMNKFYDTRYFEIVFASKNSSGHSYFVIRIKPEPSEQGMPNLVSNPSFEEGIDSSTKNPLSWRKIADPQWSGVLDSEVKARGNYSYLMQTEVAEPQHWGQLQSANIPVTGGKEYILSARMKTENSVKTYIEIDYLDKTSNKLVAIDYLGGTEPTQDWKFQSKTITIPDGVTEVNIVLGSGWVNDKSPGVAKSWFDDIELIGPIEVAAVK